MKDFRLRRVVVNLIMPVLAGIILVLFSGCGGGGLQSPEPTPEIRPTQSGTGRLIVTVQVPRHSRSPRLCKYIPATSKWLKITLSGENVTGNFNQPLKVEIGAGGTYTQTIDNIPVGLNEALIQVLDEYEVPIAQRRHGFYMIAEATVSSGTLHMGIGILPNGTCDPANMRVPNGTVLYWENWDPDNNRTIRMNSDAVSIGPITKVSQAVQPNTAAVFSSSSYTFSANGTFNYDSGYGAPGYVRVGNYPSLTSITDGDGNNYDTNTASSVVNFTLTGTNFGAAQGGQDNVKFYQDSSHGGGVYTATISSWNTTQIVGSVTIPEGIYFVQVYADSDTTQEVIHYYKTAKYWRYLNSAVEMSGNEHFQLNDRWMRHSAVSNGEIYVMVDDLDNSNYMSVLKYSGRTWEVLGSRGFSECEFDWSSMHAYNGTPYVIYAADGDGHPLTCKKFNGDSWETVGSDGFTINHSDDASIFVYNNTPYISFQDWGIGGKIACMKYNDTSWEYVGSQGFSEDVASYTQIYVSSGTPYVLYSDSGSSDKLTCKKYSGAGATGWEFVGSRGFSAGPSNWHSLSMFNGTPWVAYRNSSNNTCYCMKFNGNSWENVGTAFSDSIALTPSIWVHNGTPYVTYESENYDRIFCKKFNGNDWENLGAEEIDVDADATQIMFDNDNIYISSSDWNVNMNATVIKYNGVYWSKIPPYYMMSDPGLSLGGCATVFMKMYNGAPYVIYRDYEHGDRATCKKFNGTSWEAVGSAGFSGRVNYEWNSMSFDMENETPYVAYQDYDNGYGNCMKFNGVAWESVGDVDFEYYTRQMSLSVYNSTPYVAFTDYGANGMMSCMKLNGTTWEYVGTRQFSPGDNAWNACLKVYNGTPYLAYGCAFHKATCSKFNGTSWEDANTGIYNTFAGDQVSFYVGENTPYMIYRQNGDDYCVKHNGTSWETVGNYPIEQSGTPTQNSLSVYNGTPYVIFQDGGNSNRVTCRYLSGGVWTTLGTRGFSDASQGNNPKLFIYSGTPYVVYRDQGLSSPNTNKLTCKKFDAGAWATVGTRGFNNIGLSANQFALYVYNGTPYVAYRDTANGNKASCMFYNGTSTAWEVVGTSGFSLALSADTPLPLALYVDGGAPYVAYKQSSNNRASCMKYNGNSWEQVGSAGFSTGAVNYNISLNSLNGTPYIAYQDGSAGRYNRVTSKRFTGGGATGWEDVGSPAFSEALNDGTASYANNFARIAIYNGTPYAVYQVEIWRAICAKYNGNSWENVGSPGFSDGDMDYMSMYIYNGTPYVSYNDNANSFKCTVKRFTGGGTTGWENVGSAGFTPAEVYNPSVLVDENTGIPYVAYVDYDFNRCASCQKYTGNGATGWEYVGNQGFSDGTIGDNTYNYYISLCIYGGVPYAAFAYNGEGSMGLNKACVMKYDDKP